MLMPTKDTYESTQRMGLEVESEAGARALARLSTSTTGLQKKTLGDRFCGPEPLFLSSLFNVFPLVVGKRSACKE